MFKNMKYKFISTPEIKYFKLLLYALIVGLLAGIVGSVFRLTITYIEVLRDKFNMDAGTSGLMSWIWPVLFAVVGITVSLYLVKRFAPEASGSGIQEIEGALVGTRPLRWKRVLPVKFIASLFSLGSGLLLGREGPTVQLGANIGKMVNDIFRQPDTADNPLVSAGAAAGLSSAFNAPFAGIIFVIEEMHDRFRFNFFSVAVVMIGSGTADLVVRILAGSNPIIKMTVYSSPNISGLWLYVFLGLFFSLIGYVYNKLIIVSLNFFRSLFKYRLIFIGIISGIIIAVIGIFSPEMIGGGYDTINEALHHSFALKTLIFVFIVRMFFSIFSYGTGAPGGIFMPMLAVGVIFGLLFGSVMQHFFPELVSHPDIFAIAGMAGIFAATVRAPLTGLVLAVEMTSNFELILPLIITTVAASAFTTILGNKPIYETLLKRITSNIKPSGHE